MEIVHTKIDGLCVLVPPKFEDERGSFMEVFNAREFGREIDPKINFVQDNESISKKNVLRGLHFQRPPFAQGKLVRVIRGAVLDVVVDIRKLSSTYGHYFKILISEENGKQLWVPEGFAHGFVALEDNTVFNYKCTNYYNKSSEGCIAWNDVDLSIDWEIRNPILSDKDGQGESFKEFVAPF